MLGLGDHRPCFSKYLPCFAASAILLLQKMMPVGKGKRCHCLNSVEAIRERDLNVLGISAILSFKNGYILL